MELAVTAFFHPLVIHIYMHTCPKSKTGRDRLTKRERERQVNYKARQTGRGMYFCFIQSTFGT